MWLSDFEEAVAAMKKHCGWSCFSAIHGSAFGDRVIFLPHDMNDFYFIYYTKNKSIIKQYRDTWRYPDHYEVIYEGDE